MSASVVIGTFNYTTIVFDQPVYPAWLSSSKWSGRLNDNTQNALEAYTTGNTVVWKSEDAVPDPGPDIVSYDSTGENLVGRFNGLAVADITDFPVT